MKRREFVTLLGGRPRGGRSRRAPAAGDAGDRLSQQLGASNFRAPRCCVPPRSFGHGLFRGCQDVSVEYRWITDRYEALPAMALISCSAKRP
jgi:hypothetical protein